MGNNLVGFTMLRHGVKGRPLDDHREYMSDEAIEARVAGLVTAGWTCDWISYSYQTMTAGIKHEPIAIIRTASFNNDLWPDRWLVVHAHTLASIDPVSLKNGQQATAS